ncbi:MAG: four helix bundle protein [Microscillaceae bacterium]|jgi:four helix bundle protein|nr:four helix bundle protein [Microscillaceae bacterium]
MATIQNFEELDIWKKARELSKQIYNISRNGDFSKDFALKDQIRRASGSVMDNIAEGFERDGNREFIQFLAFAKGSCGELLSQLYRAKDQEYINDSKFTEIYDETISIGKMIAGLINHLQKSEFKGNKFKNN